MDQVLEARLEEMAINRYELARLVAVRRGDESKQRAIASQVDRIVGKPESGRFASVKEIVEALGGKLLIQWQDTKEIEI